MLDDVQAMRRRLGLYRPSQVRYQNRGESSIPTSGVHQQSAGVRQQPAAVLPCPHTETRIVQLQNHKFWAREECAQCGKFIRWPKQPPPDIPQLITAIKQANRPVTIQGSEKQIAWATNIRRTLITRFQHRPGAVMLLEAVHNCGWFIANRDAQRYQALTIPALNDIG
jgi:hypothetical protein